MIWRSPHWTDQPYHFVYLAMTRDMIPLACCPEREGIGETFFSERNGVTPLQP
ncbi:hypothetical protein [Paenibacillus sp. Root52]|uniref:hypothetical protein n=1 Tax=Paenibacillus sp. Root52 TaxID=1736552 RepID=UPI001F4651B9|nr:hypothetical protein [Paenibacillus sp. Root52]